MARLAGARVRPELRAAPSSGTTVVPFGPSPRRRSCGGASPAPTAEVDFPRGVLVTAGGGDGAGGPQVGAPDPCSFTLFPFLVAS